MHRIALFVCPLLLSGAAGAQSLFVMDSQGDVVEFAGPPSGPCAYPGGPLLSLFGYVTGSPCPVPAAAVPPPPSLAGDLAFDKVRRELWITDGTAIGGYQSFGTAYTGVTHDPGDVLAGPLTGLAYDASSDQLWIADATSAARIARPSTSGCNAANPSAQVGPFALPLGPGASATDVDLDPFTGSLWMCDDQGFVTNVSIGGGVGPAGGFLATAVAACGLQAPLTGIAVDDSAPGGAFWVTDGTTVAYLAMDGSGAAPPTFYAPSPCTATPAGGTIVGMDGTSAPLGFGAPSNGFIPIFPTIGADGQAYVGNLTFTIQVGGAQQGEVVVLFVSTASICPTLPLGPMNVHILPATSLLLGAGVVTTFGPPLDFPAPLGLGMTPGVSAYLQAAAYDPVTGDFSSTGGLALTLARR